MWTDWRSEPVAVVNDEYALRSLARYFDVMENKKPAKFVIAKKIPINYDRKDSTEKLWQLHENLTHEYFTLERKIDTKLENLEGTETPRQSFLDLKIELANRILSGCYFGTRRCAVNRAKGELGYCECGT